jgi:sugar lactone lactonase YvrE
VFVQPQAGRAIAGIYVDRRSNLLFASGTQSGSAFVFDADSGAELASYQLTTASSKFVNDVIVTREAAYFTNSFAAEIYRVPLGPGGGLPDQSAVQTIPLTGAWVQNPGAFNANGIEATSDGRWLLIVNSSRGELYRVDPQTGSATLVDLGGASLTSGDGLRRQGRTLYVVRNRLNQIAVVKLAPDFASGSVERTITDPAFEVPTTVALFGSRLYAVNARFGLPPGSYEVVQVPRK